MKKIIPKQEAKDLIEELKRVGTYQHVELHPYYLEGKSDSLGTWIRLESMIQFKGKRVVDIGCNIGYFSFKAKEAGAKYVLGVDKDPKVIEIANKLKMYKITEIGRVDFHCVDATKLDYDNRDVTLVLNMEHGSLSDYNFLKKIFTGTNEIVFSLQTALGSDYPQGEISPDNFNEFNIVKPYAESMGFEFVSRLSGGRTKCVMAYFRKTKSTGGNK